MKDFREFLLRGNLVDTAVGIVIGLAFAAVVTALVADLITPLIAAIGGQSDFSRLTFSLNAVLHERAASTFTDAATSTPAFALTA